jgi:quercetin dioxygenase-like cupin family protein
MRSIDRRNFVRAALAAAPLSACAPRTASAPSARPRQPTGVAVRAGHDRRARPRTVFGGLRIDAKVLSADTGGDLYVIEHADAARGGPPRHVHHGQDEWFYVLEGSYRLEVGADRYELQPGDAVLAPRGVPHVWAHVGRGPGRLLLAFQPAGQMEAFLDALASLGPAPAAEALRPLFTAHGMTVVGRPLPV